MSTPTATQHDYIIVGGGISGSVLARRLADKYPSSSILLIEAGGRPEGHPLIGPPLASFVAANSDIDWGYQTAPQKHLGGRTKYQGAGKVLSGGSAINYGVWVRAPAVDYDHWAELVGDESWGWKGMLPYFIKSESFIPGTEPYDPAVHGTSGPISVVGVPASHVDRKYPLRSKVAALFEKAGYASNPDGMSGSAKGYSVFTENWKNGLRQPASIAYEVAKCTNVTILTSTLVHKIVFDKSNTRALGVQTSAGEFFASKETIICAGAYRSPQILLLSGIGPASTLAKHGIPQVLNLPEVGQNLHDHFTAHLYWKLKEEGSAIDLNPSAKLSAPEFTFGIPIDWLAFGHDDAVPTAAKSEGADDVTVRHLSHPEKCHTETFFVYVPAGPGDKKYKPDGKTMTSLILSLTPTSRGSVTLASTDPTANPIIDPNYYDTEADRVTLRNTVRKFLGVVLSTPLGQSIVESELTDHPGDTDEAIDARVAENGQAVFHPAGTCAMGKVVDSACKVVGMKGLRVVDASIFPLPLGAHYQATVYAMAEKVADII